MISGSLRFSLTLALTFAIPCGTADLFIGLGLSASHLAARDL
jgi:hypothetical protein